MDKHFSKFLTYFLLAFLLFFSASPLLAQDASIKDDSILSKEEQLWLKGRNNTIVVYPEKGFPPFSYQSAAGIPQGLSIDYIELVAEKIGAKIEYLPARTRSQILEDVKTGRGDVLASIANSPEKEEFLYFTDNYITVSTVIVVRKDFNEKKTMSVADLTGKKVAVGIGYAVSEFLRKNYPRIILDQVTDDEVALQQVVLGEVDAAVMDIASLSFYMSKQVLNSVKVVGNVGYEYKLSFAVPKDKQILQSILDKGLSQISQTERQIFNDKWIIVPGENGIQEAGALTSLKDFLSVHGLIVLLVASLIIIIFFLVRAQHTRTKIFHKAHDLSELKEDLEHLQEANEILSEELETIQEQEEKIKEKLSHLKK